MWQHLKKGIILLVMLFIALPTMAARYAMEVGQNRIVTTKEKIGTIFVSKPDVLDYAVVSDNRFVIYARDEGAATVTVFNEAGKIMVSEHVVINNALNNLSDANRQIKARFPNTNLTVKKVGKSYLLEGKARSQAEAKEVAHIVGEALGLDREIIGRTIDDPAIPKTDFRFLDEYRYHNLINMATTEESSQVNVKMTVVEVNKTLRESLGVNWESLNITDLRGVADDTAYLLNTATTTVGFGTGGLKVGKGTTVPDSTRGAMNVDVLSSANQFKLTSSSFSKFINALSNDQKGRVLAEPNLSVLSGETGDILIGGEFAYQTKDADGNLNVQYKEFGVKLKIAAKVSQDNLIRLMLAQEVSTLLDPTTGTLGTRRSRSNFELRDGDSFIIGGLYSKEDMDNIQKVPLLGDIPVIGSFFRNVVNNQTDKELLIVATVSLVKPVDDSDIEYPDYEAHSVITSFFNVGDVIDGFKRGRATKFLNKGGFIQ